jgi:hypothetical protein
MINKEPDTVEDNEVERKKAALKEGLIKNTPFAEDAY